MTRKPDRPPYRKLCFSLGISALILIAAVMRVEAIRWEMLPGRLLWPLCRLHLFILIGLAAGQIVEIMGWTRRLAVIARPLFRYGKLGDRCSAAFTTAWFSGAAANAMLHDFYQDGVISKQQLYLANLVNQLPSYFLHLPTTFFIVLPLTGIAGALYFLLTFIATVLRTAAFLVYGRMVLPAPEPVEPAGKTRRADPSGKSAGPWAALRRKLPARLTGVALYVIPIYVIVFVVNAAGGFDALQNLLNRTAANALLPVESLSVVVLSFVAEFTSGFAAAGALMDAGVLTVKQTVIALLLGNILAFPVRALRHQLPRYVGIFAPRMGTEILLLGQAFRVLSLVLVGAVFLAVA
ncbi:MAG: nucleoside recognition protein [Desulfobacterales bacterium]